MEKVAIVSGASRGIGYDTAMKFAEKGYHLTIVGRNEEDLNHLQTAVRNRFGMEVLCCAGDLAAPTWWKAIVASTVSRWGRIDVLVNNAAWRTIETMHTIGLENWEKTIRICLTAPAFLAREAAVHMEKQETGGVIVNVSSIMSQRAAGYSPAYIACKGGIESLTYELAALYGPKGIRVVCVNPGNIKTAMSSDYIDAEGNNVSQRLEAEMSSHTPLGRAGEGHEIANLILWLASEEASFVTGTSIMADGGFSHNFNSYPNKKLQFPGAF